MDVGKSTRIAWFQRLFVALGAAALVLAVFLLTWSQRLRPVACFTTSLADRNPEQMRNIRIAVNAINGRSIARGARFSFNSAAGPYALGRGYVEAPALIRGHLQQAPAGGVCQVSSTLYNAALLAGMKVVERHPHASLVSSVPPGRDAMVASGRADLILLNEGLEPVQISASISGERLIICIVGHSGRRPDVTIRAERHRLGPGRFEVETWLITRAHEGEKTRETVERISLDRYEPPMSE